MVFGADTQVNLDSTDIPVIGVVWSVDWADVLLAALGLAILMLLLQWVYRSMEVPRLYITPDPKTGEPGVRWQSIVRYFVLLPFAAYVWLLVLLVVLITASGTRSAQSLALGAAAVVMASRFLAHINPEASHELGKIIPLVVLSLLLIGGSSPGERLYSSLIEVGENFGSIDNFVFMIVVVDIVMTWIWFWRKRSRWQGRQSGTRRSLLRISLRPATDPLKAVWNFGKVEAVATSADGKSDLGDLNLDPESAAQDDPESLEERPVSDAQDADRYESQRPPHHGD